MMERYEYRALAQSCSSTPVLQNGIILPTCSESPAYDFAMQLCEGFVKNNTAVASKMPHSTHVH